MFFQVLFLLQIECPNTHEKENKQQGDRDEEGQGEKQENITRRKTRKNNNKQI